ncbi:RiPP maturation radical SAM C-methyltransferase [Polyangium jinanense]|uniref:RiPP maturation radical SAM C-methyltransferase n=1 Tax=Polyangium jinanense TaxID=2829994 RepID=A0A9X4ARJ2_9BACT|nr:RiPP maturation radical SAM C-methyltransferase [Polyangium jinanense]MDC3955551.1 RiPP maturation radical SAM C-methyltransferase [Polyangium jinanense]MDC3982193.1 RiPP maturation radical SAM C-methyltransferase [Polyangium jinanense]
MKSLATTAEPYEIKLINMPFAAEHLPSLALTQIRSVLRREFGARVRVEICYLNLDVSRRIGAIYHEIEDSMEHLHTGLGDWLFRKSAFPDADDNVDEYFRRCYPRRTPEVQSLRARILPLRAELDAILEELLDQHRLHEADLVGFTSIFIQNMASLAMARKIKARAPHVVTVMGGPNCEYPMGAVLVEEAPQIDFAFSGPGLKSFAGFVRNLLDGEQEACHRIHGVISRDNLGAFVPEEDKLLLADDLVRSGAFFPSKRVKRLDLVTDAARAASGPACRAPRLQQVGEELPLDYDVELDYDDYLDAFERNRPPHAEKATLLVETSRGCWWGERSHCTFCGLNDLTLGYRAMAADQAVQQFERLFRYADRASRLMAVDVIIPKSFLDDMLPRLKTPDTMEIFYEAKSDLTEENVAAMAQARVLTIQPGVEALATSTLKLIKKGSTVFQNIMLLKRCVMYGIFPAWNLLLGIPRSDEEMYRRYAAIIPLFSHLPPPSDALQVRFDRFSPYFTNAEEYGLRLAPMEHYAMIYPFGPSKLRDMAYFFRDENFEAPYFVHLAQWFTMIKDLVATWRDRWPEKDPEGRAELYAARRGDELVIHDSRSGRAVEHVIAPSTWSVLLSFDKPAPLERAAAEVRRALPDVDMDREMEFLVNKGLLFQEGERYLSLVLPGRAPLRPEEDLRRGWGSVSQQSELRTVITL